VKGKRKGAKGGAEDAKRESPCVAFVVDQVKKFSASLALLRVFALRS